MAGLKLDFSAIRELGKAIAGTQETRQQTKKAVVREITDGGAVVEIAGSGVLTPVESSAATYNIGDVVTVTNRGGKLHIDGDVSAPSVGAGYVRKTVQPVVQAVAEAAQTAADGVKAGADAQKVADEAKAAAAATNQHFWTDTNGVHVTEQTQEDWQTEQTGGNILINSLGLLLRKALHNLVSVTTSAVAFFDGNGNESANITARFGADGAQVGKDSNCVKVESNGIGLVNDSMKAVKVSSTVTQYLKQGRVDFLPDETGTTGNAKTAIYGGWYDASSTEVSDIEIFAAAPSQVGASVLVKSDTDGTNRVEVSPELYVGGNVTAAGKVNGHSARKTLWSGTWSSGTLTVDGISGYKMLEITFQNAATHATCWVTGSGSSGYVRGHGGYADAAYVSDYFVGLNLNHDTDTLTWVACKLRKQKHADKSFDAFSNLVITSIIGVL